jgi:lysophospholipase L1-like esterase
MAYSIIVDDDFNRAATSVGSGANSTTGLGSPASGHYFSPSTGGAWIDFVGNLYSITAANKASNTATNSPGTNIPLNGCYRPSVENIRDGYVRVWNDSTFGSNSNQGCLARFTPGSGGSGYGFMAFGSNSFYAYKAVNGTPTTLLNSFAAGITFPATYVAELVVTYIDAITGSQLTFNIYDSSNLTTPLATKTITDNTASLQSAGAWGHTCYGGSNFIRLQTAQISASPLTAGTASKVSVYRTKASVTCSAATGGTGTISYQWYRSTVSGVKGSPVSGATTVNLNDTGLTAGGRYFYTCTATDSASATVDSNQLSVTMLSTTAPIFGFIGDSITFGLGISTSPAAAECNYLTGLGVANNFDNQAISGTTTDQWATSLLASAKVSFLSNEVNVISFMLGTNDAKTATQVSPSTYRANVLSIINSLKASGFMKIILNYQPYIVPGSGTGSWDASSDVALQNYQTQLLSLVDNVNVFIGDKTAYTYFQANQSLLGDGVHPTQAGANYLGQIWATAYQATVTMAKNVNGFQNLGLPALPAGVLVAGSYTAAQLVQVGIPGHLAAKIASGTFTAPQLMALGVAAPLANYICGNSLGGGTNFA